jgi:hypothetical protein
LRQQGVGLSERIRSAIRDLDRRALGRSHLRGFTHSLRRRRGRHHGGDGLTSDEDGAGAGDDDDLAHAKAPESYR